jgi:hypothetical protein
MNMYEMLFADGEKGLPLLGALGFKSVYDVGRYRSSWIEKGEDGKPRIAVYTRNGGGNREHYDEEKEAGEKCFCTGCMIEVHLPKHPLYIKDRDDDFDCTYATVYFQIPESLKKILNEQDSDWEKKIQNSVDMSDVWQKAIESIKRAIP